MQQGDLFEKQEQLFRVVAIGASLAADGRHRRRDRMPVPEPMVKKLINNALDYLADNLKKRAEQLAAS